MNKKIVLLIALVGITISCTSQQEKTASSKKKIQNRALNSVVDSLTDNVETLDKHIPKTVKVRYGRLRDGK